LPNTNGRNSSVCKTNCGRELTFRRRFGGHGFPNRGVRRSDHWESRRFVTASCKRRWQNACFTERGYTGLVGRPRTFRSIHRNLLTGEPYAGKPLIRFGGRGAEFNRSSLPLSFLTGDRLHASSVSIAHLDLLKSSLRAVPKTGESLNSNFAQLHSASVFIPSSLPTAGCPLSSNSFCSFNQIGIDFR
jgi:hypothetical protein